MQRMRAVLRFRRHVLGQVRRDLGGHRRPQVPQRRGDRRRCRRARRPRLHAQHRRPAAPPRRREHAGAARGRSARRRGGRDAGPVDALQVAGAARARRTPCCRAISTKFDPAASRCCARRRSPPTGTTTSKACATRGRGDPRPLAREPRCLASSASSARRRARGAHVLFAEGRRRASRPRAGDLPPPRRHARRSSRSRCCPRRPALNEALEGRRRAAGGDRPRRVHLQLAATSRPRTSSRRRAQDARTRSPTCSSSITARPRKTDIPELTREAREVLRQHFLSADMGISRRQLPDRRNRLGGARHQRGQRPHGDDAAARCTWSITGIEKVIRRWRTSPSCCGCCRARPPASRSPTTSRCSPARSGAADPDGPGAHVLHPGRQRPHQPARQRLAGDAALHPLRRVHEPLPGLPDRSAATPTAGSIRGRWARCSRRPTSASRTRSTCRMRRRCATSAAWSAR